MEDIERLFDKAVAEIEAASWHYVCRTAKNMLLSFRGKLS